VFSLTNIYFYANTPQKVYVLGSSDNIQSEKRYWINLLQKNPKYFQGWIRLALIENQLGNKNTSQDALNKAYLINPNSEILKEVILKIGG
jgi:hypothetical protein